MATLNGGTRDADSGNRNLYEGVQDGEPGRRATTGTRIRRAAEQYKTLHGVPECPRAARRGGRAATSPPACTSPGYSCYGNHDGLLQGNVPTSETADAIFTGSRSSRTSRRVKPPLKFVGDMLGQITAVKAALDAGEGLAEAPDDEDQGVGAGEQYVWLRSAAAMAYC